MHRRFARIINGLMENVIKQVSLSRKGLVKRELVNTTRITTSKHIKNTGIPFSVFRAFILVPSDVLVLSTEFSGWLLRQSYHPDCHSPGTKTSKINQAVLVALLQRFEFKD